LNISKKKTAGKKKDWTSFGLLCWSTNQVTYKWRQEKVLNTLLELQIIRSGYKSFYDELPTAKRLCSPTELEEITFCKIMPEKFC